MNCTNCGKALADNVRFCDGCGSPVVSAQVTPQPPVQNQQVPYNAPAQTQANEAQDNKVIFMFAYILFFLPLVSCPNSKIGRFHANQGLVLLITGIAGQIAAFILSTILLTISWGFLPLTSLISWALGVLALVVIGMISANKGEQKPLPIIGKITIIK